MALFSGEKKDMPAPTMPAKKEEIKVPARAGADVPTILGTGSEFEGKLVFEGEVRIEGKYSGQITTRDSLIIGPNARVTAEVNAGAVTISGTVEGNIKAVGAVELKAPARVKGSIETPSLSIEKGVVFEGSCKMENLAGKTPPPMPSGAPAQPK